MPPTPAPAKAPSTEPVCALGPEAHETRESAERSARRVFFIMLDEGGDGRGLDDY